MSKRNYSAGDADMLIAAATIVKSAMDQQSVMVKERPAWTLAYLTNLQTQIDTVTKTFLGMDSAKDLRKATAVFAGIRENAIMHLGFLKVQMEADFKKTPVVQKELLTRLGFAGYYTDVSKGKRQALVNHLYQFKNNLDTVVRKQLTDAGITNQLIDQIVVSADVLLEARINQNTFKSNRSQVTAEYVKAFNGVFDEVMPICKIGRRIFWKEPSVASQFVFSKVIASLTVKSKTNVQTPKQRLLKGAANQ